MVLDIEYKHSMLIALHQSYKNGLLIRWEILPNLIWKQNDPVSQ